MELNIDFEGNQAQKASASSDNNDVKDVQNDTTALDGQVSKEDVTNKSNATIEQDQNKQQQEDATSESDVELQEGTVIQFGDKDYKVDNAGNLVDEAGNVFKKADEVKEWIKQQGIEEDEEPAATGIDIKAIQEALGEGMVDDNDNDIVYPNTIDGLKSYVNDLVESRTKAVQDGIVNNFLQANPLLEQFYNYVETFGTYEGFGQVQDRSALELDKDNEAQLESVIRTAAREFGNRSLNDNYIAYLKNTGALYDEAKNQLEALVQKDRAYAEEMKRKNDELARQQEEQRRQYIDNIANVINSRTIGDFTLPEHISREINGKKYTFGLSDFVDYMFRDSVKLEDGSTITPYQYDMAVMDAKDRTNLDLMLAWLSFSGGSLKDVANYISNDKEVKKLKIKSNEMRSQRTIKVKSKPQKVDLNDIVLS